MEGEEEGFGTLRSGGSLTMIASSGANGGGNNNKKNPFFTQHASNAKRIFLPYLLCGIFAFGYFLVNYIIISDESDQIVQISEEFYETTTSESIYALAGNLVMLNLIIAKNSGL